MFNVIKPTTFPSGIKTFFTTKNEFYKPKNAQIEGLNLGFNTPDSREVVNGNRSQLFASQEINENEVVFCNQVHSANIAEVVQAGLIPETDGLITNTKGLGLCILVADCAAVLLYDAKINYVAALHAGWRGAAEGIVPKCLEIFKQKGSDLSQLSVFISPCISAAKFEVGEEVAANFPEEVVNRTDFEKPHIDLKRFLQKQLDSFGISQNQVETHDGCTLSQESDYFSFRRNGKQSGRMMGFIQLKA